MWCSGNERMSLKKLIGLGLAPFAVLFILVPCLCAQSTKTLPGLPPEKPDMVIKDFELSGEGIRTQGALIGAPVGKKEIAGVEVGLYVLQAAAPGPPRPDLPDHLFTVMLQGTGKKEIIRGANVSLLVSSKGKKQEIKLKPVRAYYQGGVRLAKLDRYRIRVSFKTQENKEGSAIFDYRMLPAPPDHAAGAKKSPSPQVKIDNVVR